jgi:hypothetical protein
MLSESADSAETSLAVDWTAGAPAKNIAPTAGAPDVAKPLTTLDAQLGIFTVASSRNRLETDSPMVP